VEPEGVREQRPPAGPGPRRPVAKAVSLHARTIEHLDQLALEQEFTERGTALHGGSFFQGGRRVTRLRFDRTDSRYPFVLDIPQSTTERLLGDHLKALGGEVERQVELVGVEREADGVTALLEHADGRRQRQRARYLPGDHTPPAPHLQTVADGRPVRLYELIRHPGHTVVLLQGERTPSPAASEVADLARALDARFGDEVRPLAVRVRDDWRPGDVVAPLVHDDNGEMHRAYDAEAASVYLIRPDGYLAFRADWTDRHVLLEFLETYLIRRYGDKARQLPAEASSTYRKLGMNG
jgi:hypothetical protein